MKRALFIALLIALPVQAQRIELIGAEIFGIDASHSYIGFTVNFLGLTEVRGRVKGYNATILYDDAHPERSSVAIDFDASSIDTGNAGRDQDLRGEAWFDVAKHPRIRFRSTSIEHKRGSEYLVHGELTIKGVARAIDIPMTRTVARAPDKAWGNIRIGGTGRATIRRKDFGIEGPKFWNEAVSEDVAIELELLGNRPNYDKWNADDEAGKRRIAILQAIQHGEPAKAPELLREAIAASPNDAKLYARSGEAYAMLGKKDEAIAMYEKALALAPEDTEATEMLRRLR